MRHTLSVRLKKEQASWLEARAAATGRTQSEVVREQIEVARQNGKAAGFMRLAGKVKGAADLSQRKGFSKG